MEIVGSLLLVSTFPSIPLPHASREGHAPPAKGHLLPAQAPRGGSRCTWHGCKPHPFSPATSSPFSWSCHRAATQRAGTPQFHNRLSHPQPAPKTGILGTGGPTAPPERLNAGAQAPASGWLFPQRGAVGWRGGRRRQQRWRQSGLLEGVLLGGGGGGGSAPQRGRITGTQALGRSRTG